MEKRELRRKFLSLRESQPDSVKIKKDAIIMRRLSHFRPFQEASEFFTYLAHRGEVSTDRLIERSQGKKRIIVPKISGNSLCFVELRDAKQFEAGAFGIREPKVCLPISELREVEVALIPGVVFDRTGHRIGFGGGYFDRLLSKLRCTTIGLAYEFQIIDKVPTASYDVPVHYIITEKKIYECAPNSRPRGL